jgi:hypothetical protein
MGAGSADAVRAYPLVFTVSQPDGTPISVRMIGDERFVFYETENGFTIMRRPSGWWHYADPMSNGTEALAPSPLRVGVDSVPAGWPHHVRDSAAVPRPRIRHLFCSQRLAGKRGHLWHRQPAGSGRSGAGHFGRVC